MSGIKKWIFAILLVVIFAGYLTINGGSKNDCLVAFLFPNIEEPTRRFAGSIGMPINFIGGSKWGVENGEPMLFLYDTKGQSIITKVCMTTDPMNPTVEFIE